MVHRIEGGGVSDGTQSMRGMLPVLLLCAGQAQAGAWAREDGEFFIAIGGNAALFGNAVRPVHYDPTIYVEYGLNDRLTLGFEGFTADVGTSGSLLAFSRLTLGPMDGASRYAISTATGLTMIPTGEIESFGRLGFHWGRGLDTGWLAVDAYATYGAETERLQTKIDSTWGYRFAPDWTSIALVQVGTGLEGDFYAKLSPSIGYSLSETIDLRMGLTHALTGDRGSGLLVETWIRF